MKHATRFNALARQAGVAALGLAHGVMLSAGLVGLVNVANATDGPTQVRFSDTFVDTAVEPTVSELAMASGLGLRVSPPMTLATVAPVLSYTPPIRLAPEPESAPEPTLKLAKPAVKGMDALGADPFAQDEGELSAEMARVRDWIADTYRVSENTIEPALAAAETHAEELGFDPLLIVAIMAVESSFNPRAVSNMGAQGLMQVIPRYHKDKLGANRGRNALFDPVVNVRVGTLVLHEGLQRYGSMQRALQYYNGALKDPKARYTRKVMALKKRLMTIAGRTDTRTGVELAG
ncbi:Membrane-bound lytic murein transglycosylase C [Thauera sp. GDN1]|uniref:lytic transglycosylase domain-containing protein n=1 Tax=Thauera sp. GDN1 TaxID=2944810 RepID=UPI0024786A19|nr:transglycosylase SLT domain-containing protein [Thauera sp. GDN1]WEN41155.1 Membrane-bound lytic murein transglycosylase C [Thauera sp. GDN1]